MGNIYEYRGYVWLFTEDDSVYLKHRSEKSFRKMDDKAAQKFSYVQEHGNLIGKNILVKG